VFGAAAAATPVGTGKSDAAPADLPPWEAAA
jgi:hypothetical protein